VYIVKPGDSPASIAQQFRIKTEDLMAANNIDDPQKLQIGQTLRVPAATAPPR
jgi:LysM repeat protein